MTAALIVDGLLILVAIIAIRGGWRQGAIASVLAAIGIVAGLVVGLGIAPLVMGLTDSLVLRFLLGLAVIVVLVGMGNLIGAVLGASLRDRMRVRWSHTFDSILGAILQFIAVMLVCWMVSVPVATGFGPPVADGVRNSTVLRGVDRIAPDSWSAIPSRISALLDESGLPPLVSPFQSTGVDDVAAPEAQVQDRALVEQIRPSVIHVVSTAEECSRRLMGSGFVATDDYVVTNAHVVAGSGTVRLDTVAGVKDAEVVYFNPEVDIAVLYSPDLGLNALPWAEDEAVTGDEAVVAGHPASGPFEASPARIANQVTISGSDIYAEGRVQREAYTVRGSIREGNSGGPLLNSEGEVLGVVFGASRDASDVGFAVTADEVRNQIGDVDRLTSTVDTQACV